MNIMELQDITFRYSDDESYIFKNFNFSIEKGKCIVVEGENGSGKTTLFRILNGLSYPGTGRYLFDGKEITKNYLRDNKNSKLFHKRIGYLFQNPDVMLFNATVYDEIAFGPRQMCLKEDDVQQRTKDCIKLFELENVEGKAPYHLSGGQKKRVALAAVMSLNPEVVILDEPFAGLDLKNREKLISFLTELKASGKTILIASHDLSVKERLADEILSLN